MEIDSEDSWKHYFDENCKLDVKYVTLSDGVKVICIFSTPNNYNNEYHPIILIPGWFSRIFAWENVTRVVSSQIPLLYLETREKNASILKKEKSTQMGVERLTEDLVEIFNELSFDISNAIGVGSSLGGSMWIQYLSMKSPKPFKTVLVGPNPNYDLPPIIGRLLLSLPLFMIGIARRYVKWHILKFRLDPKKEPEQAEKYIKTFDEADSWKVRQSARQVTKFDGWNLLSKLDSDIILVGASTDKLHAAERTLKVGKKIPNAKYIDFKSNKRVHDTDFGNFLVDLAMNKEIKDIQDVQSVVFESNH